MMRWLGAFLLCSVGAAPAPGPYIQVPPTTLRELCDHSHNILVMRVEKVQAEKNILLFRKVRDLKGKYPLDVVKLANGGFDTKIPDCCERLDQSTLLPGERRALLQAGETGRTAVFFVCRYDSVDCNLSHLYIDDQWYGHCSASGEHRWEWYYLLLFESHLRKVFYGTADRLVEAVSEVLAGKDPAVTSLADSSAIDIHAQPLDLRLGRSPVRRVRSSGQPADAQGDPKQAAALSKKLGDSDPGVRLKAAVELGNFLGRELKEALPALVEALKDKDAAVRRAAVRALRMAASDKALVPPLVEAIQDPDAQVRRKAVEALTALDRAAAREAVSPLLEALKRLESHALSDVIEALSILDRDIEAKVPGLREALQKKAGAEGKYRNLLRTLKVPNDLNRFAYFQDVGHSEAVADYQGHKNLPKGYWVYAYPYWFIWAEHRP